MALGKMASLILPYANTDMMNLFMEEASHDFKDYFVILPALDQFGKSLLFLGDRPVIFSLP
jgi:hypothetical protein